MKIKDNFSCGYACAVATIVSSHGIGIEAEEALNACGLTTAQEMRKRGIEEYDIKILTPILESIKRKENRRKNK